MPDEHPNPPDHDADTVIPAARADAAAPIPALGTWAARMPEDVGGYRIVRTIGEGGMGMVFMAEQASPRRTVALKVIRPGLADADTLRRFEIEASILGRLDHPGIATIFEAGMFDAGFGVQPFFAMEFVNGTPLTEFARRKDLGQRPRLELIARIADAVQHAHQKGVIHRDLKPANILVTESGVPKVLDFGVARATDADAQVATLRTDVGQLIGTLPYMSPEQAGGDPDALDTRSDVYALGVVAYELLSGSRPHALDRAAVHEAVRIICEDVPPPLSSVDRTLRGDVSIIVGTAIEKDRERRYQSAGDLAADIRRYLHAEPIEARPPSTTYRMRRFAARNTAAVVGMAAVAASLVGGTIVASSFAFGEAAQRRRAEAEREVSLAINEFLDRRLLGAASPTRQGRDVLVRDMLDAAASALDEEPPENERVEAALRLIIGRTYTGLGLDAESERHLRRAVALTSHLEGPDTLAAVEAEEALAFSLMRTSQFEEARGLVRHGFTVRSAELGADHPLTIRLQGDLAMFEALAEGAVAAGMSDLALDLVVAASGGRETRDGLRRRLSGLIAELDRLGRAGDHETAAELLAREAEPFLDMPLLRARVPYALASYARLLADDGLPDAAEAMASYALDVSEQVLRPDHPYALHALWVTAELQWMRGEHEAAITTLGLVVDGKRRSLGPENAETLAAEFERVRKFHLLERWDQAEAGYRTLLAEQRAALGPDHRDTRLTMYRHAQTLEGLERWTEAEAEFRDELAACRRIDGDDADDTLISIANLASFHVRRGQFAEAEPLALEHAQRRAATRGEDDADRLAAANVCAALYEQWNAVDPGGGHAEDARRWTAERDRLAALSPAPASSGR